MAETASSMMPLGAPASEFSLPDVVSGKTISLRQFAGMKGLLIMFICRHCPFVKHVDPELARLGHDYAAKDLGIVAICSNDAETYSDDAPESLRQQALQHGFTFPYLHDESQAVARAYSAACTPDYFLFDASHQLVYRGQLDASRPGNGIPVDGRDLRAAIDALLAGRPISSDQRPSIGCGITWKKRK